MKKIAVSEEKAKFGTKLLHKYGREEIRKCLLYHILAGSDGYEDIVEYFDFPDEYSVEKFIESLEEEADKNESEK